MALADLTNQPPAEPADAAVASATDDPAIRALLDDDRRVVPFESIHNFRDLGGYELADGRTIGWGRLFRADGLYRATDLDVATFDALGLRTVIDLRSSAEVADHGSFPVDRHPVSYHHLPIIDATWAKGEIPEVDDSERGTVDFLVWAYRDMLDQGADRFAAAIHTLALPESMPAVFHCAAGKDRTGVLAALVLGALGVDAETIVGDYSLSVDAMARMRAWVTEYHPEMAQRMGETPAFMLAAHPHAIREVLVGLADEHGSIEAFVHGLGVGPATLVALADHLTS
ncbi:MAG: tyrosine-protein phosphatase [Actinomycetota bacterium]